ncbi:MAG: hypothetical protein AB8U44_03675 [Aaplasma endosymbiont of Hyalomma asiaticum]
MRICVVAVVFVLAMFMLVSTYAAHGSAGSSSVDGQQECKAWYQHVLKGHQMEVGFQEDDDDELRLKVCGAWPGCTSCVEMSEGDCRYVFPTNVMVYSENQQGIDKICACQVLGCQLPWDPGKWGRKCAVPLGCYSKESRIRETEFPSSLCGSKKGNKRIKFGPLAFTHQTHSQPGVAIIMYEGDKIVDRKYMLYPRVMGHRADDDIGKDLREAANAAHMPTTLSLFNPSQDYEKHVEQLRVDNNEYQLQMYRRGDTVCIRDYGLGKRKRKIAPVVERCFPIPDAPIPVLYAHSGEVNVVSLHTYIEKKWRLTQGGAGALNGLRQRVTPPGTLLQEIRVECDSTVNSPMRSMHPTVVSVVEGREYDEKHKAQCGLMLSRTIAMQSDGMEINPAKITRYPLMRKLQNNGWTTKGLGQCDGVCWYFSDFCNSCLSVAEWEEVRRARSLSGGTANVNKYGGIYRFPGYAVGSAADFGNNVGLESSKRIIEGGTFYGDLGKYTCRFAVSHGKAKNYDISNPRCEYMDKIKVYERSIRRYGEDINAQSVLCPFGILNVDDQEYEVLNAAYCEPEKYCEFSIEGINSGHRGLFGIGGNDTSQSSEELPMMKYVRIRVKKKPKSLRRYAIVSSNGTRKRIRCDDRYSVDLYTVSQEVLNNSKVSGNRFEFPREYLGHSVSDDSKDPCRSTRSKIVYYYEHGGFVAGEEALKKCGNPVVEYYAPHEKVVGCEYDYVRADNYKPFLQGLNGADTLSVVPLSKYEQGICIDNFEKTWFWPTYLGANQIRGLGSNVTFKDRAQKECCFWENASLGSVTMGRDRVIVHSQQSDTRSRYEYAYNPKSDAAELCTLYRIEMWGGGEAATLTPEGRKRSGRPGQYVMLVLDLSSLSATGHTAESGVQVEATNGVCREDSVPADVVCIRKKVETSNAQHFFVMKIGRGGNEKAPRNMLGKGTDTVLRLCKHGASRVRTVAPQWQYGDSRKKKRVVRWQRCGTQGESCRSSFYELLLDDDCYEIARAVGGGSEKVRKPGYTMAKNIMVYYRTIYGDVLAHDDAAIGLLESHNAMFTKFSLEMNLKEENDKAPDDPILRIVNDRRYFEGRSLPRQFCRWKRHRNDGRDSKYALIPGMGGCWKSAANVISNGDRDEPGVGEDGAVMITCERWEKAEN